MYGQTMMPVAISGANGPRPGFFSASMADPFGLGSGVPLMGQRLGQERTAERWYDEAREEVAEFDALVQRVRRLANQQMRETIIIDFGLAEPENREAGRGRRDTVADYIARTDASSGPTKYFFFERSDVLNRVRKLKDINSAFVAAVGNAEVQGGVLPAPIVIERVIEREVRVPGAPAAAPNVLPWLIVGGVGLAALAAFGVFGGKR